MDFRILTLTGINVRQGKPPTYKLLIFHLKPLVMFRAALDSFHKSTPGRGIWEEVVMEEDKRLLHRRLIRTAVKTIYILGLDYGTVEFVTDEEGEIYVAGVDSSPKLSRKSKELVEDAKHDYELRKEEELGRTEPVCIGADLEFVLCDEQGRIQPASAYFGKKGMVGSDSILTRRRKIVFLTAEIRPFPNTDPKQLLRNIRYALLEAAKKSGKPGMAWKAGGMPVKGVPLGGHIHLSRIWLNSLLLRALDNYLALPLMLMEGISTSNRRPQYGFPGDFRVQNHGGFEYRTLPSWIVSPRVAKGVIALASVIANHYRQLTDQPLRELNVLEAYYAGDKERVLPAVIKLWSDLEQTETYQNYKDYLIPFKKQVMQMDSWSEVRDIRISWRIPPFHLSKL
jgi:hypothetical protein